MDTFLLLILIPVGRFLINANHWYFLWKALNKHTDYIKQFGDDPSEDIKSASEEAAEWITLNTNEIKRLVKKAGVANPVRQFMEPAGYGHVAQQAFSTLDNLLFQNTDILKEARHFLAVARGHYKTQALQSINPIYWLEVVFFLPKALVSASGLESTNKAADVALKISQVLYWLAIVWAFIYKPELFNFLLEHFKT